MFLAKARRVHGLESRLLPGISMYPTSYFSVALGSGAFALAWRQMEGWQGWPPLVSGPLGLAAALVYLRLLRSSQRRWRHGQLQAEWAHPSQFALLALIPITTLVMGALALAWLRPLALALIALGLAGQLWFVYARVAPLWRGNFCEQSVLPVFYLPTVAANFSSAAVLGALGLNDYGWLFFGAGLLAWLIYEPILLQRIRVFGAETASRPSMGIILAPAFVGLNAYFTLNGGRADLFAQLVLGYGLLQGLFLAKNLRWLSNGAFNLGLWSFSFGLASLVNVALVFYRAGHFPALAAALFIAANGLMVLLMVKSLALLLRGQLRPG